MSINIDRFFSFYLLRKPSGPRTVRVVLVLVGQGTSLVTNKIFFLLVVSQLKFPSGWDPPTQPISFCMTSVLRILFGVGSSTPDGVVAQSLRY